MVADYFSAELSKLLRRPASWILLAIVVAVLVLFGYLFNYVIAASQQGGNASQGADSNAILQPLLPQNVLATVLGNFTTITAAVALIFGAFVTGSEYGWGTLKLMLSQRPSRLDMLTGKILAVAALLAGLVVVMLLVGVLSSALIAGLQEEQSSNWPSIWQIVKGLGAGWLILAAWASLGFFLGVLFRGAALAIGVGLVYALVVEGLILGLPIQNNTFTTIQKGFLGKNAQDLASSFGQLQQGSPGDTVDPAQAVFVLLAYSVAFLLISMLLFRRRDV